MGKKKETDFGSLFEEHKGLVFHFANNNTVNFIEREDYIQSLLLKYWDLVQKFNWGKYKDVAERDRAFCGYVKTGLTRYMWELREEFNKDSNVYSLDNSLFDSEEISLLDLVEDDGMPSKDKTYYLFKLEQLRDEGEIEGVLLDYINCGNYSQVARSRGYSRNKARRDIEKELEVLRRVI